MIDQQALLPALPEIILAVGGMALLMLGAFKGEKALGLVSSLAVVTLLVALFAVLLGPEGRTLTFADMFVVDGFARFVKVLVLISAGLIVLISDGYLRGENMARFEYPVLVVLATLGMIMMVSANDLIALYMGVELQGLALYVLAAFRRDSARSSEAGLKYFVLGALASGMLLYGCSLLYGFTGSTNFQAIAGAVGAGPPPLGVLFGLVFLLAGLAFKISAVPFHMWTPDVYEGAPTPVTAFFAVAPKIAALALFTRVLFDAFPEISDAWRQVVIFLSIASMVLGAFGAIAQTDIKRLMAYSSIGHVGFALVGLAAGGAEGVSALLIYLTIYLAMNVGAFTVILSMRRKEGMVSGINELAGLSKTRPAMAAALAIFMFSLAGVPPLAGFFGKFYVFLAAIHAGLYTLAVLGVLASVTGAYYYLRIIKIMYFDEPLGEFEAPRGRAMGLVMSATAIFTLLFFLYPAPLMEGAQAAAAVLFAS